MVSVLEPDSKEGAGVGERLRERIARQGAPSDALMRVASRKVAESFLVHSGPEKREGFRQELDEALSQGGLDERILLLAGLKEAGLGYKKINGRPSLLMRNPKLSNPDPAEFSSSLNAALIQSGNPIEVLAEQGRAVLERPDGETDIAEWVESMEIAIANPET